MDTLTVLPELKSLIPPLSDHEFDLLEESIIKEGCRDPLIVWPNGGRRIIIDGHNRYAICTKHGLPFEFTLKEFEHREEVEDWMERNQVGRRNLTPDIVRYLRGRIYDRIEKQGGNQYTKSALGQNVPKQNKRTSQIVADQFGVDERTIRRDAVFAAEIDAQPELKKAMFERTPVHKAKKEIRAKETHEERRKVAESVKDIIPSDRFKIHHCNLADLVLDEPVDRIITDPPYPLEYLGLYGLLGEKSNEWLKDGGILVAMCGQSYLATIYELLSKHMDYYWTACYLTPGQPTPLRQVNVNTTWKPLLIFCKRGDRYKGPIFGDVCKSDGNDKDFHKWGQSVSGMDDILRRFAIPGQSVLDPFCGAGTTGISAIKRECTFIGCDIDEQNCRISTARISEAAQ